MFKWFSRSKEPKQDEDNHKSSRSRKQRRSRHKRRKRTTNSDSVVQIIEEELDPEQSTIPSLMTLRSLGSVNTSVINSSVSRFAVGSLSRVALSAFCYEIDSDELDVVISKLRDIDLDVQAVWVVSRPITSPNNNTIFEHWAVKIYNEMVLVDLDFYEMSGVGAFGCAPVCASWTELNDFLHYYKREDGALTKKKWEIIAQAVPTRKKRSSTCHSASSSDSEVVPSSISNGSVPIRCSKKISDICDFLDDWSERKRSYHSVLNNCQRFAFDLFRFLVGDAYPMRVDKLKQKLQSPYDHV